MPSADHVERRVGCGESTTVELPDEATVPDQDVGRRDSAVAHDVRVDIWQRPKLGPQFPQATYVEQALAFSEAGLHPLVVVR